MPTDIRNARPTLRWSALLLLLLPTLLPSAPTVIRDNRATDVGLTPALGRGYSMSANTFQGTCIADLQTTEASFDLDYLFEEIESTEKLDTEVTRNLDTAEAYDFISRHTSEKSTVKENRTFYNHYILSIMTVDSYYSSVNEATSKLSEDAQALLQSNDVLGFFSSCGPYYIRSIARRSQFLVIFHYTSETETRDESFEDNLEQTLRSFGSDAGSEQRKDAESQRFASEAGRKRLRIYIKSIGLGNSAEKAIIASEIESYKQVIKDAFTATQNEFTGRVLSMEVVPWVENPSFQNLVAVQNTELLDGTQVQRFERKLIMNENAEFYMEITRVDRNYADNYLKARLCRQYIDATFKEEGQITDRYKDKKLVSREDGSVIPLTDLDQALTPEVIDGLRKRRSDFMYGEGNTTATSAGGNDATGAYKCLKDILAAGIMMRSHREIESCQPIQNELIPIILSPTIDKFCMPVLAGEGDETKADEETGQ